MGSEVRQFVHAGLFAELIESGWKITIMSKITDEDTRSQIPAGIEIVPLIRIKNPFLAEGATRVLDKAFNLQRSRRGETTWQYGRSIAKNWRQSLLFTCESIAAEMVSLSAKLMALGYGIEQRLYERADRGNWKGFLRQHSIDAILINVPKQTYWSQMLIAAQEMGIKTFLIYHTSKDIVANARLNHFFTGIGVWNSAMKEELLRLNPWVDPGSVQVVGCGHFDCVGRPEWLPAEEDFKKEIGALPDSLLVLYPTAGPGIVPQEERYIDLVIRAARKAENELNRKIQIVFRMNPMDNRPVLFEHLKGSFPEHIVIRPDWQYIRKSNWCYARRSDPQFYNALLHFASLCITIPSTVTTDCALAGLPVINLGIEVPGEQPLAGSIRAFWEVDFNRNVKEAGAAKYVTTESELESAMIAYLRNKTLDEDKREALINSEVDGIRSGQSSRRSLRLISSGY
jgi:hypothetical protein